MKTIELLHFLNPEGRKNLAFVMKSHKRESLSNLCDFLLKWKEVKPPGKAALYGAAFGQAFTTAKDYLLRNELRLLGQEVREVLAVQLFLEQYRGSANFNFLWNEKVNRLARQGGEKPPVADPLPLENFAYDQAALSAEVLEPWLKQQIETSEMSAERIALLKSAAHQLIRLRKAEAARKLAQAQMMLSGLRRWAREESSEDRKAISFLPLLVKESGDALSAFLYHQVEAQQKKGKARIRSLETSYRFLAACGSSPSFDQRTMLMSLRAAIALEWYLAGDYVRAGEQYESALSLKPAQKHPLVKAVVANYLSNLLKAGDYANAIALSEAHEELFEDSPQADFPFLALRALCFIFLNKPSQALACIPPDIQQRPGNSYLLFRFVQVLAYGVRNDFEAAEREADSVMRMISYWKKHDSNRVKEMDIHYQQVARWLQTWFRLQSQLPAKRKEAIRRLRSEIKKAPEMQNPQFSDFLPLKWLMQEMEKHG